LSNRRLAIPLPGVKPRHTHDYNEFSLQKWRFKERNGRMTYDIPMRGPLGKKILVDHVTEYDGEGIVMEEPHPY
jgi:hypothetical protein